jgi:oxalate decarboxylase/phosphoglucose isomerase-like protein (cupin superfamily)
MKAVTTTMQITRRTCFTAMAAAAVAANSTLSAKETDTMRELLEASQNDKKGVVLYVKGQNIPGAVAKLTLETVELRSREYSRIVVRIDSIDAVAMS